MLWSLVIAEQWPRHTLRFEWRDVQDWEYFRPTGVVLLSRACRAGMRGRCVCEIASCDVEWRATMQPVQQIQPDTRLPSVTLRFALEPHRLFCWEVAEDAELLVLRERIWLTRFDSDYDYWLKPGEAIRLTRNERVRISTDARAAAEISVTSAFAGYSRKSQRWVQRFVSLVGGRCAVALRPI
jgi:Protein of unknown function (DUF2917)